MFFSIIVPLYNRPKEIDELLGSLTRQTYQQFEVLVIEDGSVNNARKIVEGYRDRLDVHYYFKENSGQGFSRNYGFERARGDYFVIFDSDCLIPPDYLQIVRNKIFEYGIDAYGGPDASHSSFTPLQKAISYSMTSPFTTGGIRGNKKHAGVFQPRSFNMGFSRKVWEATGGFILTRLAEDLELSARIRKAGFKTALIHSAFVYHKRRTSLPAFYKQLHFFGRARINIYKFFPEELKLIHFFPAAFTLFCLTAAILNFWPGRLSSVCNSMLAVYALLIFFHSWKVNKSVKVAFLSIVAAFVQLIAYGLGFMQDFVKRVIMNRR
jgi:glycosyltransferase involved in cell wall biosynthesis